MSMLSSSNNNNLPDSLYNNQETNDKNSPKEKIDTLLKQVDDPSLYNLMKSEFKRLLVDQQRLITMLQQRSKLMENDNKQLRTTLSDNQKRYEKAVREMQFFKNKYDTLIESVKPYYPTLSDSMRAQEIESDNESTIQQENYLSHSPWTSPDDAQSVASRGRKNSTTGASIFSAYSSSTEATSIYSHRPYEDKKASRHCSRNPSIAYSVGAPSVVSGSHSSVRSSTLSVLPSIIQQRKTDPLMFGGSDPLWDTISKSRGRDVTVEKIISNFLRRGGSPNTAKQSPSTHAVKYGYGMIHAIIVTKAPDSLELLLQQGANANAISISQVDEDKLSPCYLAASVGWLPGLQKLIQAGGDLMSARGGGSMKKTALHAAAENSHLSVAEYIVNMTQGVLNLETDSEGSSALHYACAAGNKDVVSFIIEVCQVPLNQANDLDEKPLHLAARHGKHDVVALLIERYGCDVNTYTTKKMGTPYDLAKSNGHKKLSEYLKTMGGVTGKKMEKKREEEQSHKVPRHLESALTKNGFFMGVF